LRPGALARLVPEGVETPWPFGREAASAAVGARLRATAGVVCADEGFDGPLTLSALGGEQGMPCPPGLAVALDRLETRGELPNGTPLEPLHVSPAVCRLAIGCWHDLDPPPPERWKEARRAWVSAARDAIDAQIADTPEHVARLAARGHPDLVHALGCWAEWKSVRDDYDPEKHRAPRWDLDPSGAVVRWIAQQCDGRTIVWVRSIAVGRCVAAELGCGFYRVRGCDETTGHRLEDVGRRARGGEPGPAVVSIGSGGEALNLQPWCRNIVLEPPSGGDSWEQMLGRTHRSGQTRPVECLIPVSRQTHKNILDSALRSAMFMESLTGQRQKLVAALG
jgi:hypothetical protein